MESFFEKETEKAYLAYLLHKGASGGIELGLEKEDFYYDFHKKVFESITDLIDQNITVELTAVINRLREKKRFQNEE
ncbi:MAG: replicative DNA helicase, partial [Leptospiraceae bacterium]|nr:replicative DNA helicase [Leptospiraceae bacterium]